MEEEKKDQENGELPGGGQPGEESTQSGHEPGEAGPVQEGPETPDAAGGVESDAGSEANVGDVTWESVSRARRLAEAAAKARQEREEREEKAEQARRLSLIAKIQALDVGEKAKLARHGDKECRSILIRDANKLIALAVLTNPKITIQEIEMIAASRNVDEDILRDIAKNKDWCKSYAVIHALVNNPKTPVPVSLMFVPKLLTNHLRFLAKSRGVPEAVRSTAKRLVEKRQF